MNIQNKGVCVCGGEGGGVIIRHNSKMKTQYEKLTTTQGTQAEDKQNKCVGHHNTQAMSPPTNNWR